jgi:hypothetical protein
VWNGLLWKAPREASHVTRFAVSYLVVIPLATVLLLGLRRFTWAHLITSTGVVWAMKLVITALLYQALARGTATNLHAVAPPARAMNGAAPVRDDYLAAPAVPAGTLRGRVTQDGRGVAGAVVYLDEPRAGRAAPPAQIIDLVIDGAHYKETLVLAHTDDTLRLVNHDNVLHTAHSTGTGQPPPTRPTLPGSSDGRLSYVEPGIYHVRCDTHPGEETWIVVVDHPYAVRTAADGTFAFDGVPAGPAHVVAVAVEGNVARRADVRSAVPASGSADIDIDFSAAREISP